MDEEFDTSVDTSDVDTSADMYTSDALDDAPKDIPEDIPENIPEDIPEDEPEMAEEDDLLEDIPEDVPEDEPEMTEEDDLLEDVPEDVPEDEPEMTEEDDLLEDVPEDVPEDEPEMTEDDLPEDIPEDVLEEQEVEDTTTDEIAEDTISDVDNGDSTEPTENTRDEPIDDTATDKATEASDSDVDSCDATEPTEDTQDEPLDDTTTDEVTEDTASEMEDTDSAEQTEDTQDKPMDDTVTEETAEDTTSDVDSGDSIDGRTTDTDNINLSNDINDGRNPPPPNDCDGDIASPNPPGNNGIGVCPICGQSPCICENDTTIHQDDEMQDGPDKVLKRDELDLLKSGNSAINQRLEAQADDYRDKGLSEDEIRDRLAADKWNFQKEFLEDAFPGQDVSPNVFNGISENGSKDRIADIENSDTLRNQLGSAAFDVGNGDTTEPIEDTQDEQMDDSITDESNTLESRITDDAVSDTDEKSAMDRMFDYMNSHNYGLDDNDTYMSDPEWISINRDLKAELGIPQTAQEQMMDYMGSHNYGIWDRDTYMKDPEWQSLNEALQNEIAGVDTSNSFVENDIVDPTEERGKISDFFASLFGNGSQQNEPQSSGTSFAPNDEVDSLDTTSQILQQPEDVADNVSEEQDFVKAIEGMDFNDLSDEDKDLMYNTAQKHIGEKYGDLVSEDRINEIPTHIKIADTEECRKAYEASGGKYSDNTVGFYCPATDEIYVDAPRNGDMTEIMATIEHESLHLASNGGLNGYLEVVEGMSTYRRSTNLNEGVTELYAMRDMEEMGFNYTSTSYQQQVEVVKALEDAIGKDTIRTAYFNNQPDLIRSEFETAFTIESELQSLEAGKTVHNGTYIDFLNSVDQYIDTNPRDPNYDSRRDTVFDWISNLKAKRRSN